MNKLITIFIIVFITLSIGCAGKLPSKCDTITESSRLCEIAAENNVRLEDIGNVLIVANAIALGEKLYTPEQALTVIRSLRDSIDGRITYIGFYDKITTTLNKYPGLFDVAMNYVNALIQTEISGRFIYTQDREILRDWLDLRIETLNRMIEKK